MRRGVAIIAVAVGVVAGVRAPADARTPTVAPNFVVEDVNGRRLELAELLRRGPVLIDFWATWCKPCIESLPELERWHLEYGPRGLTVVGVSVDGPRNFAKVRPFAASRGLHYPIVIDRDGSLQRRYQVLAIPTAFLIDTSGTIARVRVAYRPGEGEAIEDDIRARLPAEAGE